MRALDGSISIGDVVLFTTAVAGCKTTLIALFGHGGRFYEQTLYLGSLFTILDLDPTSIPGSLQPPSAAGTGAHRR